MATSTRKNYILNKTTVERLEKLKQWLQEKNETAVVVTAINDLFVRQEAAQAAKTASSGESEK